jgi:hypothetical protein
MRPEDKVICHHDHKDNASDCTSSGGNTRSSVGPGTLKGGTALGPVTERNVGGGGGGTPELTSSFGIINSMSVGCDKEI